MIKDKFKNFYADLDKQRTAAEDVVKPKIFNYYVAETTAMHKELLKSGQVNRAIYFKERITKEIYKDIYLYIGFNIGEWYIKNYFTNIKNASNYEAQWQQTYIYYAAQSAAMFGPEIQNAATQNAIRVFNALMQNPDFVTLGFEQKAAILLEKTKATSLTYVNRIVATEANRIANYAIQNSALSFFDGDDLVKFWIAGGMNIRDTHIAAMDRYGPQTEGIPMKENFYIGEDVMPRPTSGMIAKENINCKCVMATQPKPNAESIGPDVNDFGFNMGIGYAPTGSY